jgi:CHAD domain-containing protein
LPAVRETLDRERKLQPDAHFAMPRLPGESLAPRVFVSTYYDTAPRSLARCGITLRRRVEDGGAHWQLKLPRDEGRAELEAAGAEDAPPEEIAALLAAHRRHGPLEVAATLETRRVGVRVVSGERSLADVVLDSVKVLANGRAEQAFDELEVELVDGDEGDLDRLSDVLLAAGAHRTKGTPKLLRVLELDEEAPPGRKAPAGEHLAYLLGRQLRELETYDPGVRLGVEPEDLHRFRVATRRSRALIRASHPLVGERLGELGEELRWLGNVLGPARDLDVLIDHLRELVAGLGPDEAGGRLILGKLEDERVEVRTAVLEALGSGRYLQLLDRFALEVGMLAAAVPDVPLARVAHAEAARLRRAHAKLGRKPADERLHALRIKAKRARYAAELAAQQEGKPMLALAAAASALQDLIGAHQDAVVAQERVRALVTARSALAGGRMVELERERRAAARKGLPACWRRVERAIRKA